MITLIFGYSAISIKMIPLNEKKNDNCLLFQNQSMQCSTCAIFSPEKTVSRVSNLLQQEHEIYGSICNQDYKLQNVSVEREEIMDHQSCNKLSNLSKLSFSAAGRFTSMSFPRHAMVSMYHRWQGRHNFG